MLPGSQILTLQNAPARDSSVKWSHCQRWVFTYPLQLLLSYWGFSPEALLFTPLPTLSPLLPAFMTPLLFPVFPIPFYFFPVFLPLLFSLLRLIVFL